MSVPLLVMGWNMEGQCGRGGGEECVREPTSANIDARDVVKVTSSRLQSFVLVKDGSVYTAGENDRGELGRDGKRSLLKRLDALENFTITDVAVGEGFFILVTSGGGTISWGMNAQGQLGLGEGERHDVEKPRPHNVLRDGVLQACCGSAHSIFLSRTGEVYSCGANAKGQLGDGQLTSSALPKLVPGLQNRPIVKIACGAEHTLICTVGGSVYAWGCNTHGQLGVGDTTTRLRPELLRSLRAAKASHIACGKSHSACISLRGDLFSWGSNMSGQCGHGEDKVVPSPRVVERFQAAERAVLDCCCGAAHTLVLVSSSSSSLSSSSSPPSVFVMGNAASGAMGLSSSSIVTTPTLLAPASFGNLVLVGLGSGPLSNHSFLFPEGSSVVKTPLPFVDLSILKAAAGRLKSAQGEGERTKALKHARQIVADAFGSVAVLNASFRLPLSASVSPDGLCVDLVAVREAYQALLSCESDALISTLGRATLQCTSHLTSVDGGDAENLGCFLIILENPLLLNSTTMCVALERVINGLASLPKQGTSRIYSWLRHYNSEFFARVVLVVQGFLSYAVTSLQDKVALTCQILASLHEINRTARIVPDALFVSSTVCGRVDLNQERTKYIEATQANSANTRVFNFLQFPFLLSDVIKARFMKQDYDGARALQLHRHKVKYGVYSNPRVPLPPGCIAVASASDSTGVDLVFELAVRRGDHLLDDVLTQLLGVVLVDADTVKLPMRCRFVGEEGVDQGGLRKELFSLAMKELVLLTKILKPTSYSGRFLWFNDEVQVEEEEGPLRTTLALLESALASKDTAMQVGGRPTQCRGQFALGLLLGIAAYHGCMLDVRMPPCVYKLLLSKDAEGVLALSDLSEVDAALALSLIHISEPTRPY